MEGLKHDTGVHADIIMKKEKIFTTTDVSKRKTKIVCTLGYFIFINFIYFK
jgi:hypothetical protein